MSSAEAAKSCFRGAIAAFGPGEFHPGQSTSAELSKDDRYHLAKGAAALVRQPHPLFTEVLYHSALTT